LRHGKHFRHRDGLPRDQSRPNPRRHRTDRHRHGTVSQGRINDPIVVTAETHLEFSVSAREGDRYAYSPVGISFKELPGGTRIKTIRRRRGASDPLGHAAFPARKFVARGSTLQLSLFDANPEPAEFKFDLVIQRSDGTLGVIDPTIRNNPIMK
jgi:hypothetical protein